MLVNNAGIMQLSKLADADDASFDRQIAVNLKGTFNTLREAAKRLHDGGRIINLSTSIVGRKLETYGIYAATKAGVEMLTAILAKELRGRNITVNAVAPGPTATDLFLQGKSPEHGRALGQGRSPLERLGQPERHRGCRRLPRGPEAGWINGQVLRANGGRSDRTYLQSSSAATERVPSSAMPSRPRLDPAHGVRQIKLSPT